MKRCDWVPKNNPLYIKYHDEEWGRPIFNDKKMFEFIVLESAQAGLSWEIILKKRQGYKKAFAGFLPQEVAKFSNKDIKKLIENPSIIRNEAKIKAAINNAKIFLEIQKEFESFSKYIWSFTVGKQLLHKILKLSDYPKTISQAELASKDLRKRGFQFFGPVICYAHFQAVGIVNDHMAHCFAKKECLMDKSY